MAKKKKSVKSDTPLTPEEVIRRRRQKLYNREEIHSFFTRLIMMAILFFILFGVVFGITPMKNNDMMPRISSGDLLLYYRMGNNIHNQDVIVFEKDNEQYVGRIVARGGDLVEVTAEDELKVNESVVLENEIYYSTPLYEDGIDFPIRLADDEYFILCDYREGAKDSRYFGPVKTSEMKGVVITILRRSGL